MWIDNWIHIDFCVQIMVLKLSPRTEDFKVYLSANFRFFK